MNFLKFNIFYVKLFTRFEIKSINTILSLINILFPLSLSLFLSFNIFFFACSYIIKYLKKHLLKNANTTQKPKNNYFQQQQQQ